MTYSQKNPAHFIASCMTQQACSRREQIFSVVTQMEKLRNKTSNFLDADVLSVACVEGIIAQDSDNAMEKYSKKTNTVRFNNLKEIMICAATKTKIYLLNLEEETARLTILAEFDCQKATIEYQQTMLGDTTFEIQEDNVHAKIESKLCSANYSRAIIKILKHNCNTNRRKRTTTATSNTILGKLVIQNSRGRDRWSAW